jgi:hypothetical protein
LLRLGPSLLFFPVFSPEGGYIVLQARGMERLEDIMLMSAEGLYVDATIELLGQAAAGMYFLTIHIFLI